MVLFVLSSCQEDLKKVYVMKDIQLMAEGPLFDGPNTLQANYTIDLNQIEEGLDPAKIKSVKLKKAEVSTEDSLGFDNVRNFVLQLTSSDTQMEKIAVLNPVEKGAQKVNLSASEECDLLDNFQQREIIIILDADIVGDMESNLSYKGNFEFEITYNK